MLFSLRKFSNVLYSSSALSELFSSAEFSTPSGDLKHGIFEYPDLNVPEDFEAFKQSYLDECWTLQGMCDPNEVDCENVLDYLDIVDELSNKLCLYLDTAEFVRTNFEGFFEISEGYYGTLQYLHQLNNDKNVFDTLLKILNVLQEEGCEDMDEEELVIKRLINDMQIPFSEDSDELIRLNTKLDYLCQHYNSTFDQETLLDIFLTRHEFAQQMNMDSYAHMEFSRNRHALETPEGVLGFLETVDYINRNFEPSIRALQVRSEFRPERVRWTISEVLQGLETVSTTLLGLKMKPAKMSESEQWNPRVRKLTCHDPNTDEIMGIIYLELFNNPGEVSSSSFPRLGKKKSGQIPICVARVKVEGLDEDCEAVGGDLLLSYSDLRGLFHEFGHCFHSILGQTKYQFVSGSRSSKDTIEIPSLFMEYLLENYDVVKTFRLGDEEDEAKRLLDFSKDEFDHLVYTNHQYLYRDVTRQISDSKLFLLLHQIPNEMLMDNQPVFQSVFSIQSHHIVTYGPSYYTYLLSNVIAAQVYDEHFKRNIFDMDNDNGEKREVIENIFSGGSMYSSDIIENILGGQQINPIHLFELTNV